MSSNSNTVRLSVCLYHSAGTSVDTFQCLLKCLVARGGGIQAATSPPLSSGRGASPARSAIAAVVLCADVSNAVTTASTAFSGARSLVL